MRWIAPILSFTAQEAWPLIPEQNQDYVFISDWYALPVASTANLISEADWQKLITVKSAVNKHIEAARNAKLLGSNLSAKVELWAQPELKKLLDQLGNELRFVLITSQVEVHEFNPTSAEQGEATEVDGLRVMISAAAGEKCARCWHVLPDVNTHAAHPGLCGRCVGQCRRFWRGTSICLIRLTICQKASQKIFPHGFGSVYQCWRLCSITSPNGSRRSI